MFSYNQKTGEIRDSFGKLIGVGYSGKNEGKNNPDMQDIHKVGPIPCGYYTIDSERDTVHHGPYALPLIPDEANEMFGRSEFLIHGDSIEHPGMASEGCIIAAKAIRVLMNTIQDHRLEDISGVNDLIA